MKNKRKIVPSELIHIWKNEPCEAGDTLSGGSNVKDLYHLGYIEKTKTKYPKELTKFMKKIKPLKFEIDSRWDSETYYAETIFGSYCVTKQPNSTFKQGFGWNTIGFTGQFPLKKELKDAFALAQEDWVERMNKIDDCYE